MKPATRLGKIAGIKTIMVSALMLAMVLLPTVSAQSGPPEEPDPNGYAAHCHYYDTIPNCELIFFTVDLWLWAVDYAVFCFQSPSQCGLADVPTPALGAVEQGWLE